MIDPNKIQQINDVIAAYFAENSPETMVPVKKLMPAFIQAGLFVKDEKNGQPIRKVLRELDKNNQLELIPYVYPERNEKDTYWYFIPEGFTPPERVETKAEAIKKEYEDIIKSGDESYVIDLCDEVLSQKAHRRKKFDFLLGDFHKDGKTRTKLPVDAFYEELKLAVLYKPKYIKTEDSDSKKTISGMSREEQRIRYEQRKALALPKNGIEVLSISYSDFSCSDKHRIIRNSQKDLAVIKKLLSRYIPQS